MSPFEGLLHIVLTEGYKWKEFILMEKLLSGTLPMATAKRESVGELSESFQPEVTHTISHSYLTLQSSH